VITNTRPLAFRDDETKLDAFQARVLQLPEVILGVNFKIDALREVLAKLATPPDATTLRVIQEEITEAQTAVSTAKKLVTKAEDVIRQMNGAAEDIHASVDRVISLVNEEIDKLEPTMEDVRKAIADQIQLRTSAFTGLDALVKDSEAKSKARETAKKTAALRSPLEQARIDLSEAVTELTTAMAAISKDVDRLGQAQPPQGCLTTAQGALGAGVLVVTMSSDEPVAPGQTVVFLVSGGVGDVQIKTDTESQATLDVKYDTVGGVKQVVVKVKSEAKPGTYLIDVVDKVANKIVKIVVKAPPPPPLKITGADADKVKKPAAGIAPQALSYTVTGGSGTTCKATLDPKEGFADPQTFPTGDKCVIILSWAPTPKTGPYTLTVTFGEASPVVRKFTVE
jgi:5-bromo-4-chloroindolyl phosphate hydrolysis protein